MGINGAIKVLLLFSIFSFNSIHSFKIYDSFVFPSSSFETMITHLHVGRLIVIAHCCSQKTSFFHLVRFCLGFPFFMIIRLLFENFMRNSELIYFCWADPDHSFYALWSSRMKPTAVLNIMMKSSGAQESISMMINMYANRYLFIRLPQCNLKPHPWSSY